MSVAEILAELPRLAPSELELIFQRALEIQQEQGVDPSPALSHAIDEADAIPESQDIPLEEALRRVAS